MHEYLAAKYADHRNLGTPINWPTIISQIKIPTAQEATDRIFTSLEKNMGNRKKLSIFYMVFGQFLDHDITLSSNTEHAKVNIFLSLYFYFIFVQFSFAFDLQGKPKEACSSCGTRDSRTLFSVLFKEFLVFEAGNLCYIYLIASNNI